MLHRMRRPSISLPSIAAPVTSVVDTHESFVAASERGRKSPSDAARARFLSLSLSLSVQDAHQSARSQHAMPACVCVCVSRVGASVGACAREKDTPESGLDFVLSS